MPQILSASKAKKGHTSNNCNSVSLEHFSNEAPVKESCKSNNIISSTQNKGRGYVQFPEDEQGRKSYRSTCATILLTLILLAVFLILPTVYVLHSFGYINISADWEFSYNQLRDKEHYMPSALVHERLQRQTETKVKSESHLDAPPAPNKEQCKILSDGEKFDCFPESGANAKDCEARGCCWMPRNEKNLKDQLDVPYCYFPSEFPSFQYVNITETAYGLTAYLKKLYKSPYPRDVEIVKMTVKFETEDRLHIKFTDPSHNRFEPPIPEVPMVDKAASTQNYIIDIDPTKAGFRILRKSDNTSIFDSQGLGNMIYSDQFLQMSSKLPSENIYGIGEQQSSFKLNVNWQRITLFNHDIAPIENVNLYGAHPFYLVVEDSGNSHGVFLLNSNAMDVILQPTPAITFRTIGGILDFYFFLGPTPRDVVRQYTDVVGKPFMPPYWGLGFHLCKFGYNTLAYTKTVWKRNIDAGIPLDTQWNDLDYMKNRNDFTLDKEHFADLGAFVQELHDRGMHYIPIIDPGVSGSEKPGTYPPYDVGVKMDIFVKNFTGDIFVGKVWNSGTTVYPDFTLPKTVDYWISMFKMMHNWFEFDGAWIDMNEPSNFLDGSLEGCPQSSLEDPPYLPHVEGGILRRKTLCMTAKHFAGLHYDVHNLYGFAEGIITSFAMAEIRGKRPMVISRSTFAGFGHYAGHWTGDVYSKWHDLRQSIPQILNFNLFGVPLVGADICGFNLNTTVNLCNRWMQLGAFYPFARNHNSDDTIEQDPAILGPLVIKSSVKALTVRYSLLPYLYTLFWNANVHGDTVARPLFFEFTKEAKTLDIEDQFLWGPALMIVPVLEDNQESVRPYLPAGIWYDYYTKSAIIGASKRVTLSAPLDTIPVLIRGGYVIPQQTGLQTTTASRKTKIQLTAAFNSSQQGWGELYWDDGDSLNSYEERKYTLLNFSLKLGELKSEPVWWGSENPPNLGVVTILGVNSSVSEVTINQVTQPFRYDTIHKYLLIDNLDMSLKTTLVVSWK